MANVEKLYGYLNDAISCELSCEWDNDGKMCVSDKNREVEKVLICLDVSEYAVDYAIENGFDCIVSHHPLVFNPFSRIDCNDNICRKLCRLIKNDIAVFSFHTRLDKVSGGVNDALADIIGLKNVEDFSDVGRMGNIKETNLVEFAKSFKEKINADRVVCVDAGKRVSKIALVGGSGKGYLEEAVEFGCDTFVTGEMPYNCEHEAKECGINLICGGHYFTENIVCDRLSLLIKNFDENIETEIFESNPAFVL